MQQTSKEFTGDLLGMVDKTLTICLRGNRKVLEGLWEWNMLTNAVYCSDTMSFPEFFEGTKGIIHPDDSANINNALSLLETEELPELQFRIITTYGEVKTLVGRRVKLVPSPGPEPAEALWEAPARAFSFQQEAENLQLLKDLSDLSEKLRCTGSWMMNKSTGQVYYSDQVFHIHGLQAQSLNAHANTFYSFLHPEDRETVIDTLETAYAREIPVHLEYRIVLANTETRYIQLLTHWMYNQNGHPIFCGVLQDISEEIESRFQLVRLDAMLKLQEQTLALTEQHAGTGYWHINLVTRKTSYSAGLLRMYGMKQTELPTYNAFLNMVHPDDRGRVKESIEELFRTHTPPEIEFRIIRPDGKVRHLRQTGRLLIYDNAELMMIGAVQDVTVQDSLEGKLKEAFAAHQFHKAVFNFAEEESGICSIAWTSPDASMTWSDGFYALMGYRAGSIEPLQRLIYKHIHPNDLKEFTDKTTLALNGQINQELEFRITTRRGFRKCKMTFREMSVPGKEQIVGLIQDITQQETLKQQRTDAQRFNELVSEAIDECVISTNADHTVLYWNRKAEEMTGVPKSDAIFRNLFDVLPALKNELYLNHLQLASRGEKVKFVHSRHAYLSVPHHYHLFPYHDETGEITGILHVVQDTSSEQILNQRLSERLNFIENLIEASADRIIVLDRNMNYLFWNHQAEKYYAINKERILGKNILEVFPAFRNDPSFPEFRKVLKGETVYIPAAANEESPEHFETRLTPIKDEAGAVTSILWVAHDVSKDIMLQQQQQKAASISQHVDAIVIELDKDCRFVFVNGYTESLLQKTWEELQGKVIWDVFPEATNSEGYQAVRKALAENVKVEVEFFSPIFKKLIFQSTVPFEEGVIMFVYDRQASI